MDLTPVPSTTKRVRSKAAPASTTSVVKPVKSTVTAKSARSRKKAAQPASQAIASEAAPVITSMVPIDAEQINAMIATAAYYLAAQRNFSPGNETGDWLKAEQQVLRSLY